MTVRERIRVFMVGLLYEDGTPSRTGLSAMILILLPLLAALVLTTYLVTTGKAFAYYKDFLDAVQWLVTSGGGLLGANKLIISRYSGSQDQTTARNPIQGGDQVGR